MLISMGYTDEQIKDAKAVGHTEINAILDYLAEKGGADG